MNNQKKKTKKKSTKDKGYVCTYSNNNDMCKEQFTIWKNAREHMINVHQIKNPKLKKSSELYKKQNK